MNSIAPQDIWRSEAFAEDLFQESSFAPRPRPRPHQHQHPRPWLPALSSTLLCAVPVVVALLGGVVAFFHTVG